MVNTQSRLAMARNLFIFINCSVFVVTMLTLADYWPNSVNQAHHVLLENHQTNYFLDLKLHINTGLAINTTSCRIPDFNPLDSTIAKYMVRMEGSNCRKSHSWTYIDGNELILDRKQMNEDGFAQKTVKCCYKIIRKVQQSRTNYSRQADRKISLSSCIPIDDDRTKIQTEFILVQCDWIKKQSLLRGLLAGDAKKPKKTIYKGYHAIIQPERTIKTQNKFVLKGKTSEILAKDPPPNILIIGLDSTSRLNLRRQMNKTKGILEDLGAVEMFGYTKVGENTFPNYCPIFFGYSEEQIRRICWFSQYTKLDDCPSIFKRLDEANYLTALTEDVPQYNGFNYVKTGFVEQPVDFYPRPIFLAARQQKDNRDHCINHQAYDEVITSYVESAMDIAVKNQAPLFSFSWSTGYSHDNFNGIQLSDNTYFEFIGRLSKKGHLDNTILILMGDHGYRYGAVRNTLIGYYEDKLPAMWISLPPRVREKHPEWEKALQINSRRLTSPFTLHWTLNHILDTFTTAPNIQSGIDPKTLSPIPQEHRQSFFDPVPESSTCADAGVPEIYCACSVINNVDLTDYILVEGALVSIKKINKFVSEINSSCRAFKLEKTTAGAVLDKTTVGSVEKMKYIVSFTTVPGGYLFESVITYFPQNNSFSSDAEVQRLSKIDQSKIKCVQDDARLELFCYCK